MKTHVKSAVFITLIATIACCALTLSGCKKEQKIAPDVLINTPFTNQSFSYGDTIRVQANVSHPDISSVNVTLVNDKYFPVEYVDKIIVRGTSFSFTSEIFITNKTIESGKHYVRVQVFAEGESYNSFVPVFVGELVRVRQAIYTVTSDGVNRNLYQINNLGSQKLQHSLLGDASGVATNSFYNRVFMAPQKVGDLRLFVPPNDSLIWQGVNNATGGADFMLGLFRDNNAVYGLFSDGRVGQMGTNGGIEKSYFLPSGYQPIDALVRDDYLFVMAEKLPIVGKFLFCFSTNTSGLLRTIPLPNVAEHIAIKPYDETIFAVIYNDVDGEGKWDGFLLNGTPQILPNLPTQTFTSAEFISHKHFVFGTENGIYKYTFSPNGFLPISPVVATYLVYDDVNNQLLVGANSSLSVRSYPAMLIVSAYSFASELKGISILYNK